MNVSFRVLCFLSYIFFSHNLLSMLDLKTFNKAKALLEGDCSETFNDVVSQERTSDEIIAEAIAPTVAEIVAQAPLCVLKVLSPSEQYVAYDPHYRPSNPGPCDDGGVQILFKKKKHIEPVDDSDDIAFALTAEQILKEEFGDSGKELGHEIIPRVKSKKKLYSQKSYKKRCKEIVNEMKILRMQSEQRLREKILQERAQEIRGVDVDPEEFYKKYQQQLQLRKTELMEKFRKRSGRPFVRICGMPMHESDREKIGMNTGRFSLGEIVVYRKRKGDLIYAQIEGPQSFWKYKLRTSSASRDCGYEPIIAHQKNIYKIYKHKRCCFLSNIAN